jgi:transposase InsO family protein
MLIPLAANDRWSLDFVSDQFTDGRRFRVLTVVDDCTRECLGLVDDTSLSGLQVARELDRIIEGRGKPKMIVSDNGSEFVNRRTKLTPYRRPMLTPLLAASAWPARRWPGLQRAGQVRVVGVIGFSFESGS